MATKKQVGLALSEPALRKRYPISKRLVDVDLELDHILRLPTRVLAYNYQTGCLPYGHILELYGEENVGKTLLAMDYAYCCQALGGQVLYADAEGTFSPSWAKLNGLKLTAIELAPIKSIELLSDWMADMIIFYRSKLTNNEPILLVIDSTAALETDGNLTASQVELKAQMGNRAKAIDTMLRLRSAIFSQYGVCVIFINQLRSKIGATQFEDPDTTPGGRAMKFYASQRMGLYGGKMLRDEDKKRYGRVTYCRMKKTKTGIPRDNIQLNVIYRKIDDRNIGYDKYVGFIEVLVEIGVLVRKKARYYYKGEQVGHGDDKMLEVFRTNEKLRKNLIRRSKITTISTVKEQLDALTTNLYPVTVKKGKATTDEDEE